MNRPLAPAVPTALPLNEALAQSVPLTDLRRRISESARRLDVVRPFLPDGLWPHIQAGPVDADGWTLLAANAAVAAKLKQLRPRLEDALRAGAYVAPTVRIKVRQRDGG